MKLKAAFLLALIIPSFLVSCESTKSRRAGGGAFDDSALGPILDGNAIVPDQRDVADESFEGWRQLDEN